VEEPPEDVSAQVNHRPITAPDEVRCGYRRPGVGYRNVKVIDNRPSLPRTPDTTFQSLPCVVACKCGGKEPVVVDVVRTYLNCHADAPSDPNFTMGKVVSEGHLGKLG